MPLAESSELDVAAQVHSRDMRGADFLEAGVPKGPQIGVLLARARQAWLEAGCPMDEKATAGLLARALADAATP